MILGVGLAGHGLAQHEREPLRADRHRTEERGVRVGARQEQARDRRDVRLRGDGGAGLGPVQHEPVGSLVDAAQPAGFLGERDRAIRLDVGDQRRADEVALPARSHEPLNVLDHLGVRLLDPVTNRKEADRDDRSVVGGTSENAERVEGAEPDELAPTAEVILRLGIFQPRLVRVALSGSTYVVTSRVAGANCAS